MCVYVYVCVCVCMHMHAAVLEGTLQGDANGQLGHLQSGCNKKNGS